MNIGKLEEWATWAPQHFVKPVPTRRKAKRWIQAGAINGQIIGDDIFVCRDNPFPEEKGKDIEALASSFLS